MVVTLPSASALPGRIIRFVQRQAQAVNSSASNVVEMDGTTSAVITTAVIGSYAVLISDGANWLVQSRGFLHSVFGRSLDTVADAAAARALLGVPTTDVPWLYTSSQQTITFNSALTLAHGLGRAPNQIAMFLVCTTADLGYSVGDTIYMGNRIDDNANSTGFQAVIDNGDTTNIRVLMGAAIAMIHKTTFARGSLTSASWRLVVRAR